MRCTSFKPMERNTLVGFATLEMRGGLVVHDCTIHRKNNARWVSPPGRPMVDKNGQTMRKDGKLQYAPVISFTTDNAREVWMEEALRCIDEYIAGQSKR